jgi:patatin-related protein
LREKELRIALVCFGGVSLAVYMHGISKEILKLVRASRALHAIADRTERTAASFTAGAPADDPEYDTEQLYFELLREIGGTIELRVIVDIVAGASAGGINGAMLARALAHDLPMNGLRDLWLDGGNVGELLAVDARASSWSKLALKPIIWGLSKTRMLDEIRDPELRLKLSLFVRSRWFKPPFDGLRMMQLMYDAAATMGEGRPGRSLMPAGQQLELFVTLTDYHGYRQTIEIHDPPRIDEREHRHILRFGYRRWPNGEVESDFDLANAPALAFAARATSSFPGAFPPTQIIEIDRLLATRGLAWPGRAAFIARNFVPHRRAGLDPATVPFVDGSVLNNKPFREAILAINGRPAYRQVDRRLVYIDPDPDQNGSENGDAAPAAALRAPGFFAMLKGALSDIPRNEPIGEELSWVVGFNERVRRLKGIVDAARPHVTRLVSDILAAAPAGRASAAQIRLSREEVNDRVARDAGFAYEGYVRLKLAAVRAMVGQLIGTLVGAPPRSPAARAIADVIDCWAYQEQLVYEDERAAVPVAPWIGFLLAFDIDFRKRRLHFLIQGQNRIYQMLDSMATPNSSAALVNGLKRGFYKCLDELRQRERPEFFSAAVRGRAASLLASLPNDDAAGFAAAHREALSALMAQIAAEIGLDGGTGDLDALLSEMDPAVWPAAARREVLVNYLGFPFWDVLTLSVTNWRDAGEFNEILIDRISPVDARTLRKLGMKTRLKGTGFAHFAAFFSRAYRENDYLLGRLHGIDRLVDIVCDSAGAEATAGRIDIVALKRRAFECVLAAEEKHLPHCAELIRMLRREIAAIA